MPRLKALGSVAKACIAVLAGTNGAGKSSIGGALLRQVGVPYFNPDEVAREIRHLYPDLSPSEVNSLAWHEGLQQLQEAIRIRQNYAFETTLGGSTITRALERALEADLEVRIWYVGLESPELHVARVQERVAQGGHAIPEATIHQRFDSSRLNLIGLMPHLTELKVFDNSAEADPARGEQPQPRLLLHVINGKLVSPSQAALRRTPEWAKPIVAVALRL